MLLIQLGTPGTHERFQVGEELVIVVGDRPDEVRARAKIARAFESAVSSASATHADSNSWRVSRAT